ncbi:uncharacterized protein Fot_24370 [Forsythia ovata]|uniref:Protein ENHANCED DISEASE RESISTANCE 2 C-terminal domain-containing protein n=1 Tax=Forsythia ovata TaxID=205694 RepID=A0ABD1U622_9LAMI
MEQLLCRDKRKVLAPNNAAYDLFGVDVFLSPRKIDHIAQFVDLPVMSSSAKLPPILIVNVQRKTCRHLLLPRRELLLTPFVANSSLMRFLLPGDAMFVEPIQITLDKHVHWYVGLNKQGQLRPICLTHVSKGLALVNDKTDAVEPGELEHEIEMETLSFHNVQSQGNDYWQDLEILPENDSQREGRRICEICLSHALEWKVQSSMPTFTKTKATGVGVDEKSADIFEHVREDDPYALQFCRMSMIQSSPTTAPRALLQRSCPCCEYGNMLRQILEQIKKLTGQVDELKRKVDMSEERRQRSPHLHENYKDDDR